MLNMIKNIILLHLFNLSTLVCWTKYLDRHLGSTIESLTYGVNALKKIVLESFAFFQKTIFSHFVLIFQRTRSPNFTTTLWACVLIRRDRFVFKSGITKYCVEGWEKKVIERVKLNPWHNGLQMDIYK